MVAVVYQTDPPDPNTFKDKAYFQPFEYFSHIPTETMAVLNAEFVREYGEVPEHVKAFRDEIEPYKIK